jgi:hypothetical protein
MRNAARKARASGERRVNARDVRKVTIVSQFLDGGLLSLLTGSIEHLAQIQMLNGVESESVLARQLC